MNKSLLIAVLCFFSICAWEAQATNSTTLPSSIYNKVHNMPEGYEVIELHGDLATNVGPNAIVAGANDDAVYIGFNQDFGNVNISIYNNDMGGLVYSTVVNTAVQPVVIIPFQNEANGTYTLELSNAIGYAEGEFDHE